MNDNDNRKEGDTFSWSWNRSSKLKKRRRVFLSPGRDNEIPQGGKNISTELNTKEIESCDKTIVSTAPSLFMKLPVSLCGSEKQPCFDSTRSHLGKSMAAELEFLMLFTQQEYEKKKTGIGDDNIKKVTFSSHLSFPSASTGSTSRMIIGSILSKDDLSFPNKMQIKSITDNTFHNNHGLVRIVYPQGATIRRDCEIHDSSSPPIGTLPYQALRCFIEQKWLSPPSGKDLDLVPVLRYKIMLMDGDTCSTNENDDCIYGWISDRSRLDDDPYVIAECLLDM
jgi:hypothetical protein